MITKYRPKKSSPTFEKVGLNGSTFDLSSAAIISGAGRACWILHWMRPLTTLRMARLPLNDQYDILTSANVLSTPAWAVLLWASMVSQLVRRCFGSNNIGWRALYGSDAFSSHPPTLRIWSSSKIGVSLSSRYFRLKRTTSDSKPDPCELRMATFNVSSLSFTVAVAPIAVLLLSISTSLVMIPVGFDLVFNKLPTESIGLTDTDPTNISFHSSKSSELGFRKLRCGGQFYAVSFKNDGSSIQRYCDKR